MVTHCLLPEAGVYELDDRLTLYLTHSNLSNQGRGLREGAEVEISNAHVLRIANPFFKVTSKLVVQLLKISFFFPENVWTCVLSCESN